MWWGLDRSPEEAVDSNTGNLVMIENQIQIVKFPHVYVGTLCLLYINKKLLQERAEIPKVQKSSQSEEIHDSRRT